MLFLQMAFEAGSTAVSLAANDLQLIGSLVTWFLPLLLNIFETGSPDSMLYDIEKPWSEEYRLLLQKATRAVFVCSLSSICIYIHFLGVFHEYLLS